MRSTEPNTEAILLWRKSPRGREQVWSEGGWVDAPFRDGIDFVKKYKAVPITSMIHANALLEMADAVKPEEIKWTRPN